MKNKEDFPYKNIIRELGGKIQANPKYADIHNQIGLLYMAIGNLKKARKHLMEAIRINTKYREALLNLGFLNIEEKRLPDAERLFFSLSRRYPQDAFLQHILGILYIHNNRPDKASLRFQKAINLNSFYKEEYRKRGLLKKGRIELNEDSLKEIKRIKLDYHYSSLYYFLSLYLAKRGKTSQAIKALKMATFLRPDESTFHFHLGSIYYYKGNYKKAEYEFKIVLKKDPLNGIAHALLSYTYGAMGRSKSALKHMEKAVCLLPSYADLHYNLALLYSDRKRYEEAISEFKKAIRLNPNYLFARINLGILYEDTKRWKEARGEYIKVLQITPDDEYVRKRLERIP